LINSMFLSSYTILNGNTNIKTIKKLILYLFYKFMKYQKYFISIQKI
jgi:hypothetical protein